MSDSLKGLLKTYTTAVVDIDSIVELKAGWTVYGEVSKALQFYGRPVAFVGTFKSGKTYITCKILNKPNAASEVLHTPGLCLVTDKAVDVPSASIDPPLEKVKTPPVKKGPIKKTAVLTPVKAQEKYQGLMILDTAGTNTPSKHAKSTDRRAVEMFLRRLALQLAPQAVYVTGKYDRTAQLDIEALIAQINDAGLRPITKDNRLVVIHNYKNILTKGELEIMIEKVRQIYDDQERATSTDEIPWQKLPISSTGYDGYYTPKCIHIFMVNDMAPDVDGFSPKEFNNKAIQAVKHILESGNPTTLNLLDKVKEYTDSTLGQFVSDWEFYDDDKVEYTHKLDLFEEEDEDTNEKSVRLVPYLYRNGVRIPDDKLPDDYWSDENGLSLFTLAALQFTDIGIISETSVALEGFVEYSEKQKLIYFYVRIPGFNQEHCNSEYIKINWREHRIVDLRVRLERPANQDNCKTLYNGFKYGTGYFKKDLGETLRYVLPNKEDIYSKILKITDGVLTIQLQMEEDINLE